MDFAYMSVFLNAFSPLAKKQIIENVYAPLPASLHIGFCILSTILFLVLYARRRQKKSIYTLIAIDLTLLARLSHDDYTILIVALAELILLAMIFVDSMKHWIEEKKKAEIEKALNSQDENEDEAEDVDDDIHSSEGGSLQGMEVVENPIDSAFDDDNTNL